MAQRKIFNYESKILIQETIDTYGYSPGDLGRMSVKFVIAVCRFCGKPHNVRYGFFKWR